MSRRIRRTIVVFATLAVAAAGAPPAQAAPSNDAFTAAHALAVPEAVIDDTSGATTEVGEPTPSCGPIGATAWYTATPVTEASIDLSTFGSKFDTLLAVYTGTDLTDLAEIGCNDDATDTGSMQSKLSVNLGSGQTAFIQVGGYLGASGPLKLSAETEALNNDLFSLAEEIPSLPFTTTQSTTDATTEPGEPVSDCGPIYATRWYRYTPAVDQFVRLDTFGSDFDTKLAVYTGSGLGDLNTKACNDDAGFDLDSMVKLAATGGTTYFIQAGGFIDAAGSLVVNAVEFAPPENDDIEGAIAIDNPGQESVNTADATNQPAEPDPCDVLVGSTVWYGYTPAQPGPVLVDTHLSDFDTVLAIYTGSDLADLQAVGCSDDASGPEFTSDLGFVAAPGETYYIQVGGYLGEVGNLELRIRTGVSAVNSVSAGSDGASAEACAAAPLALFQSCIGIP